MKKGLVGILSLLLIAVLAGCGSKPAPEGKAVASPRHADDEMETKAPEGSDTAAEAPAEKVAEPAPAEEMKEEAAAPAAEAPAAEAPAAEAPASVDGLVGTKWVYDEIALEFKEGNKVFLKGGPLAALAPDGTDADYKLDGENFEVTVLGQTYSGTFDGTKLMVDGKEAVKEQ